MNASLPPSPITLGKAVRSLESLDFIFTETFHPALLTLPEHTHENANITVVMDGSFTETGRNGPSLYHACHAIYQPPREIHSDSFGPSGSHSLIIELKTEQFGTPPANTFSVEQPWVSTIALQLLREIRVGDRLSTLSLQGLALELLAKMIRHSEEGIRAAAGMERVRQYCRDHYTRSVQLSDLAELAGTTRVQLAKNFRRAYGSTVGEYVRSLRLAAAVRALESLQPLSQIATELGFYDQSHFSNCFKQILGVTPGAYRRAVRKSVPK